MRLSLSEPDDIRIEVLDTAGRGIRSLAQAAFPAGRHVIAWDGRDGNGKSAPPGIYWIFARAFAGGVVWTRVVMTR
jgi:flagellar hook assembly protein FlgD